MRKYDHLFFDLDNTLWDFASNSGVAMKQTLEQNDLLKQLHSFGDFFDVYEKINHALWDDYHQKKITKQALIVERFSASLQKFGISGLNWEDLNRQYLENMALQTILFTGTIEILNSLRAKGYKMYIITNGFKEVQYDKLINSGLDHFFSRIFISEEIKTTKPHRQIFEYALKSSNAPKKKSIMIGDSWETDIEGALNFGIDQIMFLNHGKHKVPEAVYRAISESETAYIQLKNLTKTYFVNEISELLYIL
ncbi:MAG: YjjG family noncanonical pyrimidine nucleotidase [Prolixibacteraceae bacterium]